MEKFIICLKFHKEKDLFNRIKDFFLKIDIKQRYEYTLMNISDYKAHGIYDAYIKKIFILQRNYIRLIKESSSLNILIRDIKFMHENEELRELIYEYLNDCRIDKVIELILEEEHNENDIKSINFFCKKTNHALDIFNNGLLGIDEKDINKAIQVLKTKPIEIVMGVI
ncbi:MAG: hypothetical protein ACRC6U_10310 [Fusobacteriaceae bacterium]